MNTTTTRKICRLTPIAAFPVYPTKWPTIAWSTIPCKPPIRLCNMVGQASFQTAGRMGPSTIDRSNRFAARLFPRVGPSPQPDVSDDGDEEAVHRDDEAVPGDAGAARSAAAGCAPAAALASDSVGAEGCATVSGRASDLGMKISSRRARARARVLVVRTSELSWRARTTAAPTSATGAEPESAARPTPSPPARATPASAARSEPSSGTEGHARRRGSASRVPAHPVHECTLVGRERPRAGFVQLPQDPFDLGPIDLMERLERDLAPLFLLPSRRAGHDLHRRVRCCRLRPVHASGPPAQVRPPAHEAAQVREVGDPAPLAHHPEVERK